MKIDDESVLRLCNSLNAISGLWPELPHVRLHILKAQEMITVLYEENKKLKREDDNPGVQFYESLGEKIFVEGSDPPGDPLVYRTVEGLNTIRQTLDEKQSEQIWRAQELIWELYKEIQKLKGEDDNPGRWLWVPYDSSNPELGFFTCSNCGFQPAHFNMAKHHLKYCPDCGKKMEVK